MCALGFLCVWAWNLCLTPAVLLTLMAVGALVSFAREKVEWQGGDTDATSCPARMSPESAWACDLPCTRKERLKKSLSSALGLKISIWWSSWSNRSFFSHRMVPPCKSQILVGKGALLDFILWKFVLLGGKRKKIKEGEKCRQRGSSLRCTDGTVWEKLKESKGRHKCLCASELTADWKEPEIRGMVWICFSFLVPGKQDSAHILNKQAAPQFSVMISLADSSSGRNSMQGRKLFLATYG